MASARQLAEVLGDAESALETINVLGNPFIGAEGWSILQEAAHAGSVKSLCGLSARQTTVDFSRLKLGLSDYTMLAAEFTCEFFRGVDRIDLGDALGPVVATLLSSEALA